MKEIERNYFHLFYLKEYEKNTVLFDFGMMPKNLFLVKEGQISLDLKISVLEIHNLIKFLFSNIMNNIYFKGLTKGKKMEIIPQEIMAQLYKFIREPKLDRLKMQNFRFIQEMNKIQNFRITILMGVEAVGLEEIFLNIPYLMKGIVVKKIVCYELAVDKINYMLKEEKQIRASYAMKSIKKILSLIERLQSIKMNCVEMASSRYNIKSDAFFDKVFSSTQFPSLKNSRSNDNMLLYNPSNKIKDNYKKKLATNEDIDYKEDINILLNKANSINKSITLEKNEKESNIKHNNKNSHIILDKIPDNHEIQKQGRKNKTIDDDNDKTEIYKKIQLINYNENPRKKLPLFKTPIRDFIIKQHPDYKKNLYSQFKKTKLECLNVITYNSKSKKKRDNNSSFNKATFAEGTDNSTEKIENNKSKPKLYTGIQMNNLFLLGDNKYYTIKKLKKQIKDFNTLDNNGKKLEIIQSNEINNNYFHPYKERKMKHISQEDIINKLNIKKKLIKFTQYFNTFHLSFVPLSVKYNEQLNNKNNNENNYNISNGNYSKLIRNSSYTEKFFVNKTMKNYFSINKKNKMNIKEQMHRVNSDLAQCHKDLPKIKNMFYIVNK